MRILFRSQSYTRIFSGGNEAIRIIFISSVFSSSLLFARIFYTGQLTFIFLVWNLFLAYVPYAFSTWFNQNHSVIRSKWKFCAFFLTWLIFIPNSFYIITDLFHLGIFETAPLWFDLAMILSFAWNGLMLGILSVRQMEKALERMFGIRKTWLFIYAVMFMNALGVYIGRFLRFNSWDVVANPFRLVKDIAGMLVHPFQYVNAWGMVVCYSLFMTLMYLTIKKMGKK